MYPRVWKSHYQNNVIIFNQYHFCINTTIFLIGLWFFLLLYKLNYKYIYNLNLYLFGYKFIYIYPNYILGIQILLHIYGVKLCCYITFPHFKHNIFPLPYEVRENNKLIDLLSHFFKIVNSSLNNVIFCF